MSLFDRFFTRAVDQKKRCKTVASLGFDPSSTSFVEDPYPCFTYLRQNEPVFRSDSGSWVITRYEDVNAALADSGFSNAPAGYAVVNAKNRSRYVCADVANNLMAFIDPPEHTSVRKLMARAFHQYMRQGLPDLKRISDKLIRDKPVNESFDLLESFASPFSIEVILQIFGLPVEDAPRLKRWTDHFFYLFTQIPSVEVRDAVDETLVEFRAYFQTALDIRRASPQNDFLSLLVSEASSEITDRILVDNCLLIFADGIENVDSGIANAVHSLLRHPAQWQKLCTKEADLERAVDECLRYESPAQFIGRVALEDVELHGQTIRKGSATLLILASANRDEKRFDFPDRFDISRSPNPYLSFGRGKHSCLGGSLVKLEMMAALESIVEQLPSLQLCDDEPDWQYRLGHRWLRSLRVKS